jgi:hypothetical protein
VASTGRLLVQAREMRAIQCTLLAESKKIVFIAVIGFKEYERWA